MNYYSINTNAKEMGYSPHEDWIRLSHAFVSDEPEDRTYVEKLEKFEPKDILFMYVNGSGIIAVGEVLKPCDGRQYTSDDRWIQKYALPEYQHYTESRIPVKWCPFENNPISYTDWMAITGLIPNQTVIHIKNHEKAEQLFKIAMERAQNEPDNQ